MAEPRACLLHSLCFRMPSLYFQFHPLAHADGNQVLIGQHGGVQAVVAAMRAHTQTADVQRNGCEALQNIARNGTCIHMYSTVIVHMHFGVREKVSVGVCKRL